MIASSQPQPASLLADFCQPGIPTLPFSFSHQGSTYAANGRIAVRLDGMFTDQGLSGLEATGILSIFKMPAKGAIARLHDLKHDPSSRSCPVCAGVGSYLPCPDCHGSGAHTWTVGDHTYGALCQRCGGTGFCLATSLATASDLTCCQHCNGEGRIDRPEEITLHGATFDAADIRTLIALAPADTEICIDKSINQQYLCWSGGEAMVRSTPYRLHPIPALLKLP